MGRSGLHLPVLNLTLAILFGALSYGGVGLHFFLAKMQFQHDGDDLFFIPIALLVLVTVGILSMRYLKLRGYTKVIAGCTIALGFLFSLTIYLGAPAFVAVIFVLPLMLSILTGLALGSGFPKNESGSNPRSPQRGGR
jgi:hydrogenase/urease accessory protein HupE